MRSKKKRVLFVTESHLLASGFGTYAKEIIPRLASTGKYEIAQLACYSTPDSFNNTDWLIYGNAPMPNEAEYIKQHNENPQVQWGVARFEYVCLDFKPDIVISYRDPWMDQYIADSPFLPFFHWVWMPTVDSQPQKPEWLYAFNRCDGLLAYSEYGIKVLKEQTHGRLVPVACASPAIDTMLFNIIPNKEKHKEIFGLPKDSFIIGTVMRNQKRKMFPELMKGFKLFLEKAPPEIAKKSYLYLHTSHPEKFGWNITSLIHEYGIGSNVLVTYVCKACKKYFCSHYRDAITVCDHCHQHSATLPGVSNGIDHKELVNIYNLMDVYVQYAICEGFGMPQVEAAACGVPVIAVNYSAMEDVVKNVKGYPIETELEREMETNADRSKANNEMLANTLLSFVKQKPQQKKIKRLQTRFSCAKRYTWDNAAKTWEKYIDNVIIEYNKDWNSPPTITPLPSSPPQNLNNQQFCEWIFTRLVQDQYHLYNYKMLSLMRDLQFGATYNVGNLRPCTQQSVYEEQFNIAKRRFIFDALRTKRIGSTEQQFIVEAHRRLRK